MHKIWNAALLAGAFSMSIDAGFVSPAMARDSVFMLSVAQAMATPEAQSSLDSSVKLYFGNSPHPAVLRKFGEYATNKKTNAVGKSDFTACSWVFISAAKVLQERALSLGANAVINIHSYYKKEDASSDTEIQCHAGNILSGIALKGDFVKVAGP